MDEAVARKRASALSEMINSEANYIALLFRVVDEFMLPTVPHKRHLPLVQRAAGCLGGTALDLILCAQGKLKVQSLAAGAQPDASSSALTAGMGTLSAGEHSALFRSVEMLLPLHLDLLHNLVRAAQRASDLADQSDFMFGAEGEGGAAGSRLDCVTPHTAPYVCIGAVVAHSANQFSRAYAPYVAGHGNALQVLGDLTGGNKKFTEWLRATEAKCGGQTLQSFLIMPVQRIPRYALLLREIVSATPNTHPEHMMLQQALHTAQKAAMDINTAVADVAEREKVGALQAALAPAPTPSLVELGARIIKTGWIDKVTGGTGLREYAVVLLPTCLVYASVGRATEALLKHREQYKATAYRLGDPNTKLEQLERSALHRMRVAYHAAEDAAAPGDETSAAAKRHAGRVVVLWGSVPDPSSSGILPNTPIPLEGVSLSLHNSIRLQNVQACTIQGKAALRIDGPPKCISLVFHSAAERDEWAYAIRAMLQKRQVLEQAAQLGEGGYTSVWLTAD
jgi:hypothetical protein